MKLKFLGTKGHIEETSRRHRNHSSLLLEYKRYRLLIDHGLISKPLSKIKPHAVLITHGHPDTFKWVLKDEDIMVPVYVTRETKRLSRFKQPFRLMTLGKWLRLGPFRVLPYRVVHSLRAPAVGFKITADKTVLYNSDLIVMKNKSVMKGVDLYVGDGSSLRSNLVRRRNGKLFGHARMSTQLNWCEEYGIRDVIFTHFGKEALRVGDVKLKKLLQRPGMRVRVAYDGMRV